MSKGRKYHKIKVTYADGTTETKQQWDFTGRRPQRAKRSDCLRCGGHLWPGCEGRRDIITFSVDRCERCETEVRAPINKPIFSPQQLSI